MKRGQRQLRVREVGTDAWALSIFTSTKEGNLSDFCKIAS